MRPHVHEGFSPQGEDPLERWSASRMRKHLRDVHELTPPMSWDIGQLHLAHLKSHQSPEESPVTENPEPEPERVNQPTEEGKHQVLLDRMIAALSGIDFDHTWVKDESGTLRGVLRAIHGKQVSRLLAWLEHGGALEIPQVRSLADDLEEITASRDQALEAVMGAQTKAADLRSQLEESERRRQVMFEEMGELRLQLDTAIVTRDRAMEAGWILERQRNEAIAETLRLEKLVPQLEDRLNARTKALATGQSALGALLSDLRREGWAESIIFKKLTAILVGTQQPSGAEDDTSEEAPGEDSANLGLATTGELIEEVRTRIDMGHCGLGYRTVDGDL